MLDTSSDDWLLLLSEGLDTNEELGSEMLDTSSDDWLLLLSEELDTNEKLASNWFDTASEINEEPVRL